MFPEHLIYYRDDQRAAVIYQRAEHIIIWCICYLYISHYYLLLLYFIRQLLNCHTR